MSVKPVKNRPYLYGLTGGIASGKSTASNFFIDKGVKVFDSDFYVKRLWVENESLIETVNKKYNINMETDSGKKELADIIFSDELEKIYINSLIHPLVFDAIEKWIEENINEKYLVIDMPLLFESSYENKVDKTIVIYTGRRNQITRLMKRDGLKRVDAEKRIKSQIDLKLKKSMASLVINNNSTIDKLYKKLELLYEVMENEN